jgi:ribosomal protein L32E
VRAHAARLAERLEAAETRHRRKLEELREEMGRELMRRSFGVADRDWERRGPGSPADGQRAHAGWSQQPKVGYSSPMVVAYLLHPDWLVLRPQELQWLKQRHPLPRAITGRFATSQSPLERTSISASAAL